MAFIDIPSTPAFARGVLPTIVEPHVAPVAALIAISVGTFLLFAIPSYLSTWPNELLSHPKYRAQSRTYPVAQLQLELENSLWTAPIVSILAYPVILRLNDVLLNRSLNSVDSEEVIRTALALWLSYDFGGYLVHRILHSNSVLYEWIHETAHKWIIPTPFATLAASPLDVLLRLFMPIAAVPFVFSHFGAPVSGQLYFSLVGALLTISVLAQDCTLFSTAPLCIIFHGRAQRLLHSLAVPPFQVTASGQKRSRGNSGFEASLPYPINLAPLTTLPDRLLGTFYAYPSTIDQPVVEARKAAEAWRKSKEAIGGKERKTQQAGWAIADKYARDGAGLLKTRNQDAGGSGGGDTEGDVDGLLG